VSVVYSDVQELAAEFASLEEERINPFIARAERQINEAYFGTLYDDAVLYMTAHLLKLAQSMPGGAGPVTSETAGSLSRSYAVPDGCPADLAATSYGVQYWALLRRKRYQAPYAS
jgi:hypothetical protein